MNLNNIATTSWILALFKRDDGERFLLGDGFYEFKESLQHFQPNNYANDVIELQGADGQLLAGQVRRSASQSFDGYIGDASTNRQTVEARRREFLMFFRKRHFYTVIYIFADGSTIQRQRGYIVDAPSVPEMIQHFPEYHVALNFEDVNYYEYAENSQGEEIYSNMQSVVVSNYKTGGLIWDNLGAVSEAIQWGNYQTLSGDFIQINDGIQNAPMSLTEIDGNASQTTYSGKNQMPMASAVMQESDERLWTFRMALPAGTYTISYNLTSFTLGTNTSFSVSMSLYGAGGTQIKDQNIASITSSSTIGRKSVTFTIKADATTDSSDNIRIPQSTWNNGARATLTDIQIEAGSTPTSYEQYVGGISAPNPDYPQAIDVVTGAQTVGVTGKNLFDVNRTLGTPSDTGYMNTAKRLFNYDEYVNGLSNTNYYNVPFCSSSISDGVLTVKPTNSGYGAGFAVKVQSQTNYVLSFNVTNASQSVIGMAFYEVDGTFISTTILNNNTLTFTTPPDCNHAVIVFRPNANQECSYSNIQLELGSQATSYEPFTSQSQEINLGKNLTTFPASTYSSGDVDFVFTDETISASGTATSNWTTMMATANFAEPLQPGTYTFSIPETLPNTLQFKLYDASGTATDNNITAGNKSVTFTTTTTNTQYSLVYRAQSQAVSFSIPNKLMLQAGSTATTYADYFTPIELAKIGTYQDKIYFDSDTSKWMLHKETQKLKLTSTINMSGGIIFTNYNTLVYFYSNEFDAVLPPFKANATDKTSISSFALASGTVFYQNTPETDFGDGSSQFAWDQNVNNASRLRLAIDINFLSGSTDAQRLASWKSQLDANDFYILAPLATPTDTEITNQALLDQLNNIYTLYGGVNNISPVPSEEQGSIKISYASELNPGGGFEWEDGGTGGTTTITINGVDNALPVWTITGPATNPTLTNITTNQAITWTGTIPSGQTLIIDMDNQTATMAGANVYAFISGEWLELKPGANRISYSVLGSTDPSTLSWNNIVG